MEERIELNVVEYDKIDGTKGTIEVGKTIANEMYMSAPNISVANAAMDLYKTGSCERTPEVVDAIKHIIERWGYVIRTAVEKNLK